MSINTNLRFIWSAVDSYSIMDYTVREVLVTIFAYISNNWLMLKWITMLLYTKLPYALGESNEIFSPYWIYC